MHAAAGIPELVARLQARGAAVFLVSGGFRAVIDPIADLLAIPRGRVFANTILFHVRRAAWAAGPLLDVRVYWHSTAAMSGRLACREGLPTHVLGRAYQPRIPALSCLMGCAATAARQLLVCSAVRTAAGA